MRFRILTWNVENLFRPTSSDAASARAVYQRKLRLIADTLVTQRIDVAAFQEIGSPEALGDLQRALQGEFPHVAVSEQPDPRGIRVAVLSRRSFTEVAQFALVSGDPAAARRHRGALRVELEVKRRRVSVITAHLKSKLLSFRGADGSTTFTTSDERLRARVAAAALIQRATEAVTLRNVATTLLEPSASLTALPTPDSLASSRHAAKSGRTRHPSRQPVILLGDLNDVPEAATTQILLGPPGSQPGTHAFARNDSGDSARLFNLANFIPVERRYSRINGGVPELIDHILVSQDWLPERLEQEVDAHVDLVGTLPSVGEDPKTRRGEEVPDHAPVTAALDLI